MMVIYLLLAAVLVLIIGLLVVSRPPAKFEESVFCCAQGPGWADRELDLLALELAARIFRADDSRLIAAETGPDFALWFDSERKTIALDWLREVRGRVRQIIREHRKVAGRRPDANPVQEMKLASEFVLFELTSGILFLLICLRGPADLSKAVERLLEGTARLRKAAERALSPTRPEAQSARS